MASPSFSLRDTQKAAIVRLLVSVSSTSSTSLPSAHTTGSSGLPGWCDDWKVLIYDNITKQLISPLLTLSELRACGVTLTLPVEAPRDRLPDIPALFFVGNLPLSSRLLVSDAADGRYRDFSVAFVAPITRQAMEALAAGVVAVGAVARITRVLDVYSSFVALQPRLYSGLGTTLSFTAFASPSASEDDVTQYAKTVVNTVLSICATCAVVPVIVASRGGPAEMVARLADQAIRDHLASPSAHLFTGAAASTASGSPLADSVVSQILHGRTPAQLGTGVGARPAFILLDRSIDMAAPLAHASSYEALVDDCVGPIVGNRITLTEASEDGSASKDESGGGWLLDWATSSKSGAGAAARLITLDPDNDAFWHKHSAALFPEAIEAHERELAAVTEREAAIRRQTGQTFGDPAADSLMDAKDSTDAGDANSLIDAIDSLPQLLKRKKALSLHTTLLHAVMKRVAARVLPHFHDAEAPALFGSYAGVSIDRAAVLARVGNPSEGEFQDRLRLAAIYLLTCGLGGAAASAAFVQEEMAALLAALKTAAPSDAAATSLDGANELLATQVLSYIKHLRTSPSVLTPAAPHLCTSSFGSAAAGREGGLAGGLFATLQQTTSTFLNKAVTKLTQGDQRLPVTRIVAAICEGKPSAVSVFGLENYLVMDPRQSAASSEKTLAMHFAAATAPGPAAQAQAQFKSAVVCMVGGATYAEQADLQQWAQAATPQPRTIVYGGTEILSPSGFLQELADLGKSFVPILGK